MGGISAPTFAIGSFGNVFGPASSTDNAIARFDGATGKLIQNSSAFIDDSGNVGIGTAGPTFPLDIRGINWPAGQASLGIKQSGANDGFVVQASGNTDVIQFYHTGTVGAVTTDFRSTGGFTPLTFLTSGLERVRIDTGGNVGIGVTSPRTLLEVSKAQNNETAIQVTNTTSGSSAYSAVYVSEEETLSTKDGIFFHLNSGYTTSGVFQASGTYVDSLDTNGLWLGARNAAGKIHFYTGGVAAGNERVTIDSAGLVGIGTIAPGAKLQVVATSNYRDLGTSILQTGSSYFAPGNYLEDYTGGSGTGGISGFTFYQGLTSWYARITTGNVLTSDEIWRIDASHNFLINPANNGGKVGIGTTSPGTSLEVVGTTSGIVPIFSTIFGDFTTAPGVKGFKARGTASVPTKPLAGDGLTSMLAAGYQEDNASYSGNAAAILFIAAENFDSTHNGTYMTFSTTPIASTTRAEAVRIDSTQNVGFGVTSPTAVIHLKAGTATASTAPLKLTSGTKLTTAEAGVHEYNGNHLLTNANIRFPVGGTLFDHYADANNTNTAETDLYSDTLAASTFASNGDKVTAHYGGTFSGAALSTQELKAYFGGTLIFDTGTLNIGAGNTSYWDMTVVCIRESSSNVRCTVALNTSFAALASYSLYTKVTGLTLTNTQILKLTGQAAGAGGASSQITATEGFVQFLPAA